NFVSEIIFSSTVFTKKLKNLKILFIISSKTIIALFNSSFFNKDLSD
ncbi:unnamed protein product, partial [marine sediment metagenome]